MFVLIGLTAGTVVFIVELLYYNEIAPRPKPAKRSLALATVPFALTPAVPSSGQGYGQVAYNQWKIVSICLKPNHFRFDSNRYESKDSDSQRALPVSGINYNPQGPDIEDFQNYWVFGQPMQPVWHLRPEGELYFTERDGTLMDDGRQLRRRRKQNRVRHRSDSF